MSGIAGEIGQGILIIAGGAIVVVISRVILRSDTWVDINTDLLMRRRAARDVDPQRLAWWIWATSFVGEGFGWLVVALGVASLVVVLL